jgi:hypothetical protein
VRFYKRPKQNQGKGDSMGAFGKYLVTGLTVLIALSACSPKKFADQNKKNEKLAELSNLFLDSSQIIGGANLSPIHKISSHIVALYDLAEGGLCTGSIISEDIILTAGHCIPANPASLVVLFGVDARNAVIYRQALFAGAHKNFLPKESGAWSDIGLVYFSGGLPEGYTPISILADEIHLQKGVQTELAGYGLSDGVNKTGSGYLRHTLVSIDNPMFQYGEVTLDQTKGTGACHGDSGGPAFVVVDSEIKLWGVTSRGEKDPNDDCSQYAVYTSANTYLGWINKSSEVIHKAAVNLNEAANTTDRQVAESNTQLAMNLVGESQLFR